MLFHSFFAPRKKGAIHYILGIGTVCVYLLLPLFPSFQQSLIVRLAIPIALWTIYAAVAFQGNFMLKLLVVIGFLALLSALDYLVLLMLMEGVQSDAVQIIKPNSWQYFLGAFCARTAAVFLIFCIKRWCAGRNQFQRTHPSTWILLLAIPAFSIVIFGGLFADTLQGNTVTPPLFLQGVGILAVNIALFFTMQKIDAAETAKEDARALQLQADTNLRATNDLMMLYQEQRTLTHDFNHHITALHALLEAEQCKAAQAYTARLIEQPLASIAVVSANHPVIDVLLNQKYLQAKQQNTAMRFTVNDLSAQPFAIDDIVIVLGNTLDNALEACAKLKENAAIEIKLLLLEPGLLISIRNTALGGLSEATAVQSTSKSNTLLHGYGLKNIKRVLKKYDCECSLQYENGWFSFSTLIL